MLHFLQKNTLLATAVFFSPAVFGQISGVVFHDFNANGSQQTSNPTEPAIAGATITAYKPDGTSVSATADASGNYSFTAGQLPSGTAVRLEFSGLPTYANQLMVGGTLVQFLTAGAGATNVDLGVTFPGDYCQSNPFLVTPCYVETGDPGLDIVVRWSYNNTGTATGDKAAITQSQMAGSLWGVAYSRSQKLIYTAAVLKTHIPLGTEGLDAIYTIDPFSGSANATPWLELTDDLGIAVSSVNANPQYLDNATRGVNSAPQNDAQAFVDVGKVGIGDIELSADEKTLYVVNLFDKKLYAIDIATQTLVTSIAIPNPGCTNGQARPWAIGEYEGSIFVGVTCDGSSSGNPASLTDNSGVGNLSASVYRLDGASFTQVLSFPLDYNKEVPFQYSDGCDDVNRWKPWTDVVPDTCTDGNIGYPTPLLTDLEFDDNGHMILGFTDRTGFQFGYDNYGPSGTTLYSTYAGGDILRACKNGSVWGIESVGSGCSSAGGLAIGTLDVDGYDVGWDQLDKAGEFYEGDFFHENGNFDGTGLSYFPGHPEITIGGLAVVPGTGEVMATAYDPVTGAQNYNTGGVISLSNTTGKRPRNGFQLYATPTGGITQGKGVGLGDLEALCDARPIEITTRVWTDADDDGVQDPAEAPIADVCFEIFADFDNNGSPDGAALGTASSDSDGFLFFTSSNVADGDPNTAGNQAGPQVGKKYLLRVCASDWTGGAGTGDLTNLYLTQIDADGTTNGDARDSDAALASSIPQIPVTAALTGQSQFTLGAGFTSTPPPCAIEVISATPSACAQATNSYTLEVEITYANQPSGDLTINGQTFTPNGSGSETFTLTNLTADGATGVDVTAAFVNDAACTHTLADAFDAPADCSVPVCPDTTYSLCAGESYTLTADMPLTNPQWQVNHLDGNGWVNIAGAISQSYTVQDTGMYRIIGLDANGCNAQLCCPYKFAALNCPEFVAIGNLVFMDTNEDGNFDSGTDMPLENVIVELYASTANPGVDSPLAIDTTDANGHYLFDQLAPGQYIIYLPDENFGLGKPLENKISASPEGGDTATDDDSDENGQNLAVNGGTESGIIDLQPNAEPTGETGDGTYPGTLDDDNVNMTVDFAFVAEKVAIGNLVFMDVDQNGTFNAGDMGLDGVVVELYASGANPGVDAPLATTTTANGGFYLFDEIAAGVYFVYLPAANFGAGQPLENKISTGGDGSDDTSDDNADENGQNTPVNGGTRSADINLQPNDEPSGETGAGTYPGTLDDDNVNLTVDFGFKPPCAATVTVSDAEICSGSDATLTAVGTGDLLWSTGETTTSITVNPTSTADYSVTLTDAFGCTAADTATVTVVPTPNAGSNFTLVCGNGTAAPTTYDLGQAGNWAVFSQPAGAAATVDANGLVADMTEPGDYVFRLSVSGATEICHDDVLITRPDCPICPPKVCLPVVVNRN